MELKKDERELLRTLASRYMEIATLPVQAQKRDLWKALNRSRMERPMVVIDQLPWNELNTDGSLTCRISDPFWRGIEWNLRSTIYKWEHFPVDMVVEPFITIPKSIHSTGYGLEIQEHTKSTEADNDVVSHQFVNQLETEEDIEKISDIHLTHNEAESRLWMDAAAQVFDGVAPIRQSSGYQFHLGVWDYVSMLMGVENAYLDMMDRPEFIHKIMERMTRSVLAGIRDANELGIHNDTINTCHCSYIYTDELLPDFGQGKGPESRNSWAFGLAQLFSSVSPAFTAFAEKIGPEIIMSNKPSPAFVAMDSLDESIIREDLRRTVALARENKVNLELILKDISTVRHHPERLTRWAEIAMEEVQAI